MTAGDGDGIMPAVLLDDAAPAITSPPPADRIDELIGIAEGAEAPSPFLHPLLPGYAFPREPRTLDIGDMHRPNRIDRAVLDAFYHGLPTVLYDRRDGVKVVAAVIVPAADFATAIPG